MTKEEYIGQLLASVGAYSLAEGDGVGWVIHRLSDDKWGRRLQELSVEAFRLHRKVFEDELSKIEKT